MSATSIARRVTGVFAAVVALSAPILAHDPGLSSSTVDVDGDRVDVVVRIHADGTSGPGIPGIPGIPDGLVEVTAGGRSLDPVGAPTFVRLEGQEAEEGEVHVVRSAYRGLGADEGLSIRVRFLASLPDGHRHFVRVLGDRRGTTLLESTRDTFTSEPSSREDIGRSPSFGGFFRLGVLHIVTGYDHLLFLLALLLGCASLGAIARIVTVFTIAHSVTLVVASLGLVTLPASVVEPIIAASIVYVAVLALLEPGSARREPLVLTFVFGLVHGLGFAGMLGPLLPPDGGIVVPLVSFNLGVEAGQLALSALALPVLLRLRRAESVRRVALPIGAMALASIGLYWLVERTVLAV